MYLIVEFEGEGTTGPVAKSWYEGGYSWWPPYKDRDRMLKSVRTLEPPQPEKGWTRHRARILHESASFHNVVSNWKKASYTSDISSESEIAGKRIPKKKTCSDHIYSTDDEAPEPPPLKKRKTADKESVPPAPKPPAIPKCAPKKGPVVRPQVLQSRAVNSLSNSFVNQQQRNLEDQQQTRCESLPSFQAPVGVSQAHHHGDGWGVDPPNTRAPVGVSQTDYHRASWDIDSPNTQEHTFSVLRPSGDCDYQGRSQTPVDVSQTHRHGAGWGVDPPNTQGTSGVGLENPVLSQCTSVERAILETLQKMDVKINHLTSLVQSLVGNRRFLPQIQDDDEDGIFPLVSTEDLDRLEQSLLDRGFMQRMVNRLSISGGPTMKKTVWRICFKVFTTNVARQLNWCGRGDKRGIKKSNIGSLLIASAMRNPVLLSPTEAEAEKFIKDFLRLAPGRV
ncbi:uncharacterized protein [Pseudorasbora parva]|uniref:uncharacterized protein isoform X2 n=1 Tax=Pseudorasbora parva TaxID=51549 RepID=UPI00351EA93E